MTSAITRLFAIVGLACLLILSMSAIACAPVERVSSAVPAAPAEVADRVLLDEQGLLALELAYKAARLAAEAATDAGAVRGETAAKVARVDNAAFTALGAARRAYAAGNAPSYAAALSEGRGALEQLIALVSIPGARP
jgi:hypothetical protein